MNQNPLLIPSLIFIFCVLAITSVNAQNIAMQQKQAINNTNFRTNNIRNYLNINAQRDNRVNVSRDRRNPTQKREIEQIRSTNLAINKVKQKQKIESNPTVRVSAPKLNITNENVQLKAEASKSKPSKEIGITFGRKAKRKFTPSAGKRVPTKYRVKNKVNLFAKTKKKDKRIKIAKNNRSKKECTFLAFK